MGARVLLPTVLRPHADGQAVVTASGSTLREVFADLSHRYPDLGRQLTDGNNELPVFINVFLGDQDVRYLDGLGTAVPDDAEITILPAVAGG
jgi:molybdopterin converting factor small subunit